MRECASSDRLSFVPLTIPVSGVWYDRAVIAVICLAALGRWLYVATAPLPEATFRITDDAYYYYGVARNIVLGNGCSFDGRNATNGFHPLWMMTIMPLYWLCHGNGESGLRAVLGVTSLLGGGTGVLLYGVLRRWAGRAAATLGVIVFVCPFGLNAMLNGLETGLLLVLVFALVWAAGGVPGPGAAISVSRAVAIGALLGLIVLCRLDCAFVVAGVAAMECAALRRRTRGTGGRRRLAVVISIPVVAGCLVLPFCVWNAVNYGHVVPISGQLKSTFPYASPVAHLWHARMVSFPVACGTICLAVSAAALTVAVVLRGAASTEEERERRRLTWLLAAAWLGNVVHYAFTLRYEYWAVHWWHYASYLPWTVLSCGLAYRYCTQHVVRARLLHGASALVLLACVLGALYREHAVRASHHTPWYDAALWSKAHLPDDAIVGMTDCGLFGYWCGRPTVNLDGVINGYEYQRALYEGRLREYLQRYGVTHIAHDQVQYEDGQYRITLRARLYRAPGCMLIATPAAEVYRSADYRDAFHRDGQIHFAVWEAARVQIVEDASELDPGPWLQWRRGRPAQDQDAPHRILRRGGDGASVAGQERAGCRL